MLSGGERSDLKGRTSPLAEDDLESWGNKEHENEPQVGEEVLENVDTPRVRNSTVEVVEDLQEDKDVEQHANIFLGSFRRGVFSLEVCIVPHRLAEQGANYQSEDLVDGDSVDLSPHDRSQDVLAFFKRGLPNNGGAWPFGGQGQSS